MSIKNLKSNSSNNYSHGKYTLENPEKYVGKHPIVYRSSWEYKFCVYCDRNPLIVEWSSESLEIPYLNPLTKRNHRYYPDFFIRIKTPKGDIRKFIIEIKPSTSLKKPEQPKRNSRKAIQNYRYAANEYIRNSAKFRYANQYALRHGMKFVVLTEKTIHKWVT